LVSAWSAQISGQEPLADVVLHLSEGPRYIVNRITFVGNTRTHDDVIRREMRLVEGAPFSTAALRESLSRLNQLGYFKPLQGTAKEVHITKTTDRPDALDVTICVEEQDRHRLEYGGGLSQTDGLFGNVSYVDPNVLGGGESLRFSSQQGARSSTYQLAFSKPYLRNRITAGVDLFSNKIDFLANGTAPGYTVERRGISARAGYALRQRSHLFLSYAYESIGTTLDARHVESRVTPGFAFDTIDNPLTPRRGSRITAHVDIAGGLLGGTTNYIRPEMEVVQYVPHTSRTALGVRASAGWVKPFGSTNAAPYYLRHFLGGENQIRGVDIRTVGPIDSEGRAVGGDKYVLFNAEYYFDAHPRVRLVLFHDAGQAYAESQPIDLRQLRSSSGIELRLLVPKLNVPLRFIYGLNTRRDEFQPARAFTFAVGVAW
jgi:outer membrane protein insertion porin family